MHQRDRGGSIRSIPDLINVCVCPPQISMIIQGRVAVRSMAAKQSAGIGFVPIFIYETHGVPLVE